MVHLVAQQGPAQAGQLPPQVEQRPAFAPVAEGVCASGPDEMCVVGSCDHYEES